MSAWALLAERRELIARAYREPLKSEDSGAIWLELKKPIGGADDIENQASRILLDVWRHRPSRLFDIAAAVSAGRLSPGIDMEDIADALVTECCACGWHSVPLLAATDEDLERLKNSLNDIPRRPDVVRYIETEIRLRGDRLNSSPNTVSERSDLPNPAFVAVKESAEDGIPLIGGFIAVSDNIIQRLTCKENTAAGEQFQTAIRNAAATLHKAYRSYSPVSLIEPLTRLFEIPIDGASVGLAAWLFGWLRFRRLDPPLLLAATGNVIDGKVLGADPRTIDQKISAALATGYMRFLAPAANRRDSVRWKDDIRVIWIDRVDQIVEWFASQSIWNARRDVEMLLSRKTLLPLEAALEGLDLMFRENLRRDRPFSLIRDLRASLRESVARCRVTLFKNVIDRLRMLYLNLWNGNASHGGNPEAWVSWLRHLVSPEIFFFHLPFLLRELHERGDSGLRERLASEMLHRVLDHDVDASMALVNGRKFFDPLAGSSKSIFCNIDFRKALPHLLWMALDEPSRAILVLAGLDGLLPFEEEWLRSWIQVLAGISPDDYARAGISEYRSFLEPVMTDVLGLIYPGFRPGLANPCAYPERLANLWLGARLVRERFGEEVARPLEQHFQAHLRAPKPASGNDIPAALADYPEFPHLIGLELPALRSARKKLDSPQLGKRPILDSLRKTIDDELRRIEESAQPASTDGVSKKKTPPEDGSPKGWQRELSHLLNQEKLLSEKRRHARPMRSKHLTTTGTLHRSLWMTRLAKAVCDSVTGTVDGDKPASSPVQMFIQPMQLLANFHLSETVAPHHFFDSLQGWCAGHQGGRSLAAQCLAYQAVRMALIAGKALPKTSNMGTEFHLAVVAALVTGQAGDETSLPPAWLETAISRIADAEPQELLWLLWIPPALLPELRDAVDARARALCASLDNHNPDYDRSRAEIGLFVLGASPWRRDLPGVYAARARKALREQLRQYRENPDLSRYMIQICAPWYLLNAGRWRELVPLFKKTVHRTTTSTFAVMYAALILCRPNRLRDRHLHLSRGGLGIPRLWASSLERQMFGTTRLLEAFTRNDRRLMTRLFLWRVEELPNLFLASRLIEKLD
ncbi:MAG: hypothetical protein HQM09_08525 [Candidatus Riflebacteria bacterium]|nr:hypothetical protein [Candidatus Riflebacteria bacterium]